MFGAEVTGNQYVPSLQSTVFGPSSGAEVLPPLGGHDRDRRPPCVVRGLQHRRQCSVLYVRVMLDHVTVHRRCGSCVRCLLQRARLHARRTVI